MSKLIGVLFWLWVKFTAMQRCSSANGVQAAVVKLTGNRSVEPAQTAHIQVKLGFYALIKSNLCIIIYLIQRQTATKIKNYACLKYETQKTLMCLNAFVCKRLLSNEFLLSFKLVNCLM